MKRFALATFAALALTAVSQEQAKAWFNIGAGGSGNANISWGGWKHGCTQTEPWPQHTFGAPQYNYYGAASTGAPAYPVNPYGMNANGGGFGGGYIVPPSAPLPSGGEMGYMNLQPVPSGPTVLPAYYQPVYQQPLGYYAPPAYYYYYAR